MAMPAPAHGVVRVRFGSNKRAAKALVDFLSAELGDAARVVLRRNHAAEESPAVVVGVEFFSASVHLSDDSVWSGQPNNPVDKECAARPNMHI
jgi:hypothetical protein